MTSCTRERFSVAVKDDRGNFKHQNTSFGNWSWAAHCDYRYRTTIYHKKYKIS